MSPLSLEAVFERVPMGRDVGAPSSLRFGLRARVEGRGKGPKKPEETRRDLPVAVPPVPWERPAQPSRGPTKNSREAGALRPEPWLLAYSSVGLPIALLDAPTSGRLLDLRA